MIGKGCCAAPSEPADILEETVRIPTGHAELFGVLAYPIAGRPLVAALIVGPHPMMGGRLQNNVVRAVGRGLAEHGFLTLRFSFGGGGVSAEAMDAFWRTGRAPDDPARMEEAKLAFEWLKRTHPASIVVVGYSFGASLLCALSTDARISHLVLIGPTLFHHDYQSVAVSAIPKLVITADNDFATPVEYTQAWFAKATAPKRLVLIRAAEHFYRGQEPRLVEEILDWARR